jgi:5-hydroxyisourate hydrolase-like protein (transthyretin family)
VSVGPWYILKPGRETEINLSGTTASWSVTGADGCVVLDWLPERFEQSLPIVIRSEQYYSPDHESSIIAEKPVDELTINLLPLEKLSGRVTHADGRPATGMAVVVRGQGTTHHGFHGGTRTDRDGRYELKVYSEQAYLVAAGDGKWAAPCRADILVRAGQPVDHVDLVLGPTARLHGRVTVGRDQRPVANTWISAVIDKGPITKELPRKADDRYYYGLSMNFNAQTDAEGRYEFRLAPGDYQLRGPARTETVKLSIPAADSTAEIVQDFHMPRAETGPFAGRVVDRAGKPLPGAIVEGHYASMDARRWFGETKADEHGAFQIERSLDPLVIHARSTDGKLAGVARSDSEATQGEIVVAPTANASGRLKDMDGKPLAQKELTYGIRIYQGSRYRARLAIISAAPR